MHHYIVKKGKERKTSGMRTKQTTLLNREHKVTERKDGRGRGCCCGRGRGRVHGRGRARGLDCSCGRSHGRV